VLFGLKNLDKYTLNFIVRKSSFYIVFYTYFCLFKIGLKVIYMKFFLCFLSFIPLCVQAQRSLVVVDKEQEEPLPFVKVIPDIGQPLFTNIDGKVILEDDKIQRVHLAFPGFKDTLFILPDSFPLIVRMESISKELGEIVVLPGENPAHRIIRKVTENRKKNHPLSNDSFTYDSYSKFVLDFDSIALNELIQDISTDSLRANWEQMLRNQHVFLLESSSQRRYIPPARDREEITAYKVSGLSNPIFASFAQSIQSFHFYDNRFELFGKEYVNPIAFGGLNRYFFLLEDSTVINGDTTFMISFRPQPKYREEMLQGRLFINTNGYAIEKVIVQPANTTSEDTEIKIIQEYKQIDDYKWFPVDLKTHVVMRNIFDENKSSDSTKNDSTLATKSPDRGYLEGRGNTYISNIVLNPQGIKKKGFNNVTLSTAPDSGDKTDEYWDSIRKDSITEQEKNTYRVLDSLNKAYNIDMKMNGLLALATGRIRIKYIAIPIERLVNFNLYEGYRFGAGLETSDRVMKNVFFGSYFGWGTRDKEWKYGGYSTIHLNRRLGMKINVRYQQDILERGSNVLGASSWSLFRRTLYANFYQKEMDKQRLAEFTFSVAPLGNLTFNFIGSYQRIDFTNGYIFSDQYGDKKRGVDLAQTSVQVKWSIRQRAILLGDIRMTRPTNFPEIQLQISKVWKGIEQSSLDYWRLFVSIDENIHFLRFGQANIHAQASQSIGKNIPLTFMQQAPATRHTGGVVTASALETAFPAEFYHDQQMVLITRYFFPPIRMTKTKFAPQIALHHGIGYGKMTDRTQHNLEIQTIDKGLFEGGIILRNLFSNKNTLGSIKYGLGLFYRYGTYADPEPSKNFVLKIDIAF